MSDITIINSGFDVVHQGTVPVGPLYIVSMLEKGGIAVDFKDYQLCSAPDRPSPDTFCDFIDCDTPLIGISVMCNQLPTVLMGIERLKRRHPEKTVILGGPSATDSSDYILNHFPVDIVVRGEGEVTALELMRALESKADLSRVQGISYRKEDRVHHNPPRPRVENLDTLPFPAYDRIDFDHYHGLGLIFTARGCPYHCSFCSAHSVWERRVTYRSAESVTAEMALIQHRVKRIPICDDTFVLNARRVREIIAAMKRVGIERPWDCFGRVNLMSNELLKDMAEAGCCEIYYGMESGSNRVLKHMQKEFTVEEANAVVKLTLQYVPHVRTTYIWGFPFESLDDFYDTVAAMAEGSRSPTNHIQSWLLSPMVASPLYREYHELLKFSPTLELGLAVLPGGHLSDCPELVDFIARHPDLCAAYYYFDHPSLMTKVDVMRNLGLELGGS